MITVILIVLALAALAAIAWVVIPKLPIISALQVAESPAQRFKRLKMNIVLGRIARRIKEQGAGLTKKAFTSERRKQWRVYLREVLAKLKNLEERYQEQTKEHQVAMLLKQGEEQSENDPEGAEEKFLRVVRLDPRNVEAYEGLLTIYFKRKNLNEAAEVVDFLKKLNPASMGRYAFTLAKLFLEKGELTNARKYGGQAFKDEPGNPKYLDFLTELAILGGKRSEAAQYLERLRAVNPENGKIEEFEERIKNVE